MNYDANGRPLPPGWGKKKRRRGIEYRIRRKWRRAQRFYRIMRTDHSGRYNALWLRALREHNLLIRGSHLYPAKILSWKKPVGV